MLIREKQAIILVALLGAVPALPGAFVLAGILQGPHGQGMLHELVNPRYFALPGPIALHIGAGIVFCLLAPLQFSTRLRANGWHRFSGRIAVLAGLVFGLSALAILGPIPSDFTGWVRYLGLTIAGLGVSGSITISLFSIWRRKIAAHRIWMLRAIAMGLIGASRILFDVILGLAFPQAAALIDGLSIWLAVGFNLLVLAGFTRRAPKPIPKQQPE